MRSSVGSSTGPTSSSRTSRPAPPNGWGWAPRSCARDRPELVVVNMSGYGAGGPLEQRKAYDMLIQAEAGLISITGTPETAVKTGIPTADIASGMYLRAGCASRRCCGGGGPARARPSRCRCSRRPSSGWATPLYTQMYTGAQPPRMGLSHTSIAPYDAYPTSDGRDAHRRPERQRLAHPGHRGARRPELAEDPRSPPTSARVANRAACDAEVAARTSRWTSAELDVRLAAAGIPAAQVKGLAQVVEHAQLRARDRWRTVGPRARR